MYLRFILAALFVFHFNGTAASKDKDTQQSHLNLDPPVGKFVVVDVRQASDVVSRPAEFNKLELLGESIEFTSNSVQIDDIDCNSWEIIPSIPPVNMEDPLLSDIGIGLTDYERGKLSSLEYICEGEPFIRILQIDERVLILPWNNSSQNLILERPISTEMVTQLQENLRSLKFYDGRVTGKFDADTVSALAGWVEYSTEMETPYRFARPAVTTSLLRELNVVIDN